MCSQTNGMEKIINKDERNISEQLLSFGVFEGIICDHMCLDHCPQSPSPTVRKPLSRTSKPQSSEPSIQINFSTSDSDGLIVRYSQLFLFPSWPNGRHRLTLPSPSCRLLLCPSVQFKQQAAPPLPTSEDPCCRKKVPSQGEVFKWAPADRGLLRWWYSDVQLARLSQLTAACTRTLYREVVVAGVLDAKPSGAGGPAPEQGGNTVSITVVGASGDLAKKKIFPALFALFYEDWLPEVSVNFLWFFSLGFGAC